MPLSKLQFNPGVNREVTAYTNEGGWFDSDNVRFQKGYPEKIGGWQKRGSDTFLGTCRALHPWVTLNRDQFIGVGTNEKYYIDRGGEYNDITPLRSTTAAGAVTFARVEVGSPVINVIDAAHGAVVGDFVTFSGAASLGASITANVLNQEYKIDSVENSNSYRIKAKVEGSLINQTPTLVNAANGDSGNGGGSIVGKYQINVGLNTTVRASGWGAGSWGGINNQALQTALNQGGTLSNSAETITVSSSSGIVANDVVLIGDTELVKVGGITNNNLTTCVRGFSGTTAVAHADGSIVRLALGNVDSANDFDGWGDPSTQSITANSLRLWSNDNFGEDLLINVRDGGLFYWDATNGLGTRAVNITTLSSLPKIPTVAKQVLVSDRDRHVIAFGCDPESTPGVQDPLTIRFSSQESITDWEASATNTAGELRLGSGSEIVTAIETRQQILVMTDTTLYAMQFLGPPFTFGVTAISENITIAGPNAAIAVDDNVFWMGRSEFYVYSGTVQRLPCMVRDYVFSDLNENQLEKINVALNTEHSEVWWFYPSSDSEEVNKYVVYNYLEQVWYYGSFGRTAWVDRGIFDFPIAANNDGSLYEHELGFDDGTTNPASAINAFIQSSPMDIGDGQQFMFIQKMIPDIDFKNSTAILPETNITLDVKNAPDGTYNSSQTDAFVKTQAAAVDARTEQLYFRLRGRQMRFKISSDDLEVTWRLGSPRVDIRSDGRR